MRQHIAGIDHCFALVRDLDAASDTYRRLGFTVSPRGTHSAHKGTANHTIMFERDYFELLGVVTPTPANAIQRGLLAAREGLAAIALRTPNVDAAVGELRAAGIRLSDPLEFSRPVELPDGRTAAAAFRTSQFPDGAAPGFHLFCCQHRTPETTWLPELLHHENTAWGLDHLTVLSATPRAEAEVLGALLDVEPVGETADTVRVDTGTVAIHFVHPVAFAVRHAGLDPDSLPAQGLAALALRVRSLDAVHETLGAHAVPYTATPAACTVASHLACGVVVQFVGR